MSRMWPPDEQTEAKKFWDSLSHEEKGTLGDHFVWGCFDWREWGFEKKPSRAFLNHVERLRLYWEDDA